MYLSTRVAVTAAWQGRLVEEVAIDEPFPRGAAFRVSNEFSLHTKQLQDSLMRASAANADEVSF